MRKLWMTLGAIVAALGFTVAATTPAQAFAAFTSTPWACWTQGQFVRLDVQNPYGGSTIYINWYDNADNGFFHQSIVQPGTNATLYAKRDVGGDIVKSVHVTFLGGGNLNWFYQQRCVFG